MVGALPTHVGAGGGVRACRGRRRTAARLRFWRGGLVTGGQKPLGCRRNSQLPRGIQRESPLGARRTVETACLGRWGCGERGSPLSASVGPSGQGVGGALSGVLAGRPP